MSKELFVSSTPHQTKVALVENDTLSEVYFERENEYTLAGSIYKGRVTRVLPGMQSAFVDVGLERDAFLYVSDFFEMEGEDETFEPIPAAKPFELKPQEPKSEPMQYVPEPQQANGESLEGGYAEEAEAPSGNGQNREEEGEGGRRWRGRRRRGRGRGRGFPESKFAPPASGGSEPVEEETPDETFDKPMYKPIILPGESLAKFRSPQATQPAESAVEADSQEEIAESQTYSAKAGDAQPDTPESEDDMDAEQPGMAAREEPRPAVRMAPPQQYQPIVLPGESISKYRKSDESGAEASAEPAPPREQASYSRDDRRDRGRGRDRDRGRDRGRDRDRGDRDRGDRSDRTREFEAPRPFEPILLPGESISKYRKLQDQPSQAADIKAEPAETSVGIEAAGEEHAPAQAVPEFTSAITELEQPTHEISQPSASFESHAAEDEQPHYQHEAEAHDHRADVEEQHTEERYQDMNVASVFGGDAAEHQPQHSVEAEEDDDHIDEFSSRAEDDESHESEADTQAEPQYLAPEPRDQEDREDEGPSETPSYQGAPEGAFVEEELEAEEEDLPHPAESLYDEEDFEELEEEILEPMPFVASGAAEVAEATKASAVFEGGYEGDDEEDAEIDEVENAAYAEIGEPEAARAELRGPSGTAGYQQRAPRPDFDRNRRGRRGGSGGGGGQRRFGRGGPRRESMQRQHVVISDLLKEGQEVLVQIAKEPIGKKGARITSHIALPGRFLVYMPTVNHIGVSRKISSDEERMRLKRIVMSERENGHGGFIVRTAAAHIAEEDLRNDIRFLKNLWHDIRNRAETSKPPALIYHDLNLVERIMRDLVTQDFTAIWVDTEQEYERVSRFMSRFQPALVRRVKLYTKETPLFEQFGIDAEINKALKSKVWLKSGGYIVINQTEALVAIDINTGKYVGKTSRLEDTIVKTNIDAIREIVRQIRLRDLGGIIVIDFIDMDERKNRQKVMQALEEEMRSDRAPSKVLQFNDFGLVAITRKRVKQSLERTLGTPCPYCTGNGYVKSPPTVCNEIYVEMRKMAKQFDSDILLRVNPEVAKTLKANNGKWLMEMEELTGQNILVKSDPTLHQEQFDM
jgi:Rne/Rng family ribonuclease